LTSDESQELKELPESLVIIGGGYIALELGQMFHRFGTRVTILERSRVILPNYEPEVSDVLTFALREEGLQIVTGAQILRVLQKSKQEIEVMTHVGEKEQSFKAQKLLVATGREPNTDSIGLDTIGIQLDERGFVKGKLQTKSSCLRESTFIRVQIRVASDSSCLWTCL
jgi:mercuric reductase